MVGQRLNGWWIGILFGALGAFCVLMVPSLGHADCLLSPEKRRAVWTEYYAPSFGSGQFLEDWAHYPGCLDLRSPDAPDSLKRLKVTEEYDLLKVRSANGYPLFLDADTFAELAFVLLKAERERRPLHWELNSDGGWVEVNLILLEMLGKMTTPVRLVISENSMCYSACLLLAAGFANTFAHPNATFGFHGASLGGEISREGTRRYIAILIQLGVNPELLRSLENEGVFDSLEFFFLPAHQLQGSGLFREFLGTQT